MNLVLADTEEFRATKKSLAAAKKAANSSTTGSSSESTYSVRDTKRTLGLVILRGETIISVSVEAPPPNTDNAARLGASAAATAAAAGGNTSRVGTARPINRSADATGFGVPSTASTLSGPARTTAASFFGSSSGPAGFGAPPGFQPPPGFGGR